MGLVEVKAIGKDQAIEILDSLASRAAAFQYGQIGTVGWNRWRNDAVTALRRIFPGLPEYVKEFTSIQFQAVGGSDDWGKSVFTIAMRRAEALLLSRRDEVATFGFENAPGSGPTQSMVMAEDRNTVFVIHGRQMLPDFHSFLRALGLKPLEWARARGEVARKLSSPNPYTWQIVDFALQTAGAIVALLTPDDEARLREDL